MTIRTIDEGSSSGCDQVYGFLRFKGFSGETSPGTDQFKKATPSHLGVLNSMSSEGPKSKYFGEADPHNTSTRPRLASLVALDAKLDDKRGRQRPLYVRSVHTAWSMNVRILSRQRCTTLESPTSFTSMEVGLGLDNFDSLRSVDGGGAA